MRKCFLILLLIAGSGCNLFNRTNWYSFAAPDQSFKIAFPGGPPVMRTVGEKRNDYSRYGDGTFMVEVIDDTQYSAERASKLLSDYPNPGAAGIHGRVVDSSPLTMGQYIGRAVRIEGTADVASGRVIDVTHAYVGNGRLYLVMVSSRPGERLSPNADRFFESFAILK